MLDDTQVATLNSKALEAAFHSTVGKMQDFFANLDPAEKTIFHGMLEAARDQTDEVQAKNEGEPAKTIYDKPVQVHATSDIKMAMKRLPDLFPA